jgi:hypothetical protein
VCAGCGHGAQGTRVSAECITYNDCSGDDANSAAIGGPKRLWTLDRYNTLAVEKESSRVVEVYLPGAASLP